VAIQLESLTVNLREYDSLEKMTEIEGTKNHDLAQKLLILPRKPDSSGTPIRGYWFLHR
jgi:hypothetical protein